MMRRSGPGWPQNAAATAAGSLNGRIMVSRAEGGRHAGAVGVHASNAPEPALISNESECPWYTAGELDDLVAPRENRGQAGLPTSCLGAAVAQRTFRIDGTKRTMSSAISTS